jgi:hypothetical protein
MGASAVKNADRLVEADNDQVNVGDYRVRWNAVFQFFPFLNGKLIHRDIPLSDFVVNCSETGKARQLVGYQSENLFLRLTSVYMRQDYLKRIRISLIIARGYKSIEKLRLMHQYRPPIISGYEEGN